MCDICQHTCDSIDLLSEHKLKHSDKKKFICRYCRTWGYTKECDHKLHEEKCAARLASLEKVQVPKCSTVKKGSKKDGAKRKLFSGPLQTSLDLGNAPSTSLLTYDQTSLFDTEESELVTDVPTSCQQPT